VTVAGGVFARGPVAVEEEPIRRAGMGRQDPEAGDPLGYEPPRVAQVLTPADLEREVLYAGQISPDSDGG
jgi:hypothetical protein